MTQGMVTTLEITEMKWVIADLNQTVSVKEQRVDGSLVSSSGAIRCTLVAGKPVLGRKVNLLLYNHHQSIFLYVQRNKFHSSAELLVPMTIQLPKINLHLYYVTGFADGESSVKKIKFMDFIAPSIN
jgi:hypothetical protein